MVSGLDYSFELYTMVSLIYMLSGVILNPQKVAILCRKLSFYRMQ